MNQKNSLFRFTNGWLHKTIYYVMFSVTSCVCTYAYKITPEVMTQQLQQRNKQILKYANRKYHH